MRVNINKSNSICPICKQPLIKGELGTLYAPAIGYIYRAHVDCVKARTKERNQREKSIC